MHETPRQRRRQQRLDDLVEAGLVLLGESGLDGITVARVAERVDLTPGALYRYYPSKDALLAALLARVLQQWGALFDEVIAAAEADGPPLLAPVAALSLYVRLAQVRPLEFGLLGVTLADPRVLVADPADAVHGPALRGLLLRIGSTLIRALPRATLADVAALVFGLTGVLGVGKLRRYEPALDPAALAHRLIHAHLVGLGAAPDAVDAAARDARALLVHTLPGGPA